MWFAGSIFSHHHHHAWETIRWADETREKCSEQMISLLLSQINWYWSIFSKRYSKNEVENGIESQADLCVTTGFPLLFQLSEVLRIIASSSSCWTLTIWPSVAFPLFLFYSIVKIDPLKIWKQTTKEDQRNTKWDFFNNWISLFFSHLDTNFESQYEQINKKNGQQLAFSDNEWLGDYFIYILSSWKCSWESIDDDPQQQQQHRHVINFFRHKRKFPLNMVKRKNFIRIWR